VAPGTGQTIVLRSNGFDFSTNNFGLGSYSSVVVRTADVLAFLEERVAANVRADYFGNPNPPFLSNGQRQNSSEPYAFLNFFADPNNPDLTFNEVVLTDDEITGFESDNHTIATSYEKITGMEVFGPSLGHDSAIVNAGVSVA
jgi:hypothetical protein